MQDRLICRHCGRGVTWVENWAWTHLPHTGGLPFFGCRLATGNLAFDEDAFAKPVLISELQRELLEILA